VLLVTACVFFGDVLVRRVTIHFYWVGPALAWLWARIRRREQEQAPDKRMERLRSRKAEIGEQLDERRAAARFEPQGDEAAGKESGPREDILADTGGGVSKPPRAAADQPPGTPAEKSYTERLLEAKRKAWKDKDA